MTDDLDRLLPLIDEPAYGSEAEIAGAEARVWARITDEQTVVRRGRVPSPARSARRSGNDRWVRPLSIAAAGTIVVAGLVAIALVRRDATTPADVPTTTVPVMVLDRSEACAEFRRDGTPFAEFDDAIVGGASGSLERAVDALDQLRADLATAGVEQADLDALEQVRGGVVQAELHVSEGDADSALLALEFANRAYTASGLFGDRCLG